MKKVLLFICIVTIFSSCYTVTQVGNCKYYKLKPQYRSSYYKEHKPVGF